MSNEYLTCPFCGDDDFDKVGLKMHLQGGFGMFGKACESYVAVSDDNPNGAIIKEINSD